MDDSECWTPNHYSDGQFDWDSLNAREYVTKEEVESLVAKIEARFKVKPKSASKGLQVPGLAPNTVTGKDMTQIGTINGMSAGQSPVDAKWVRELTLTLPQGSEDIFTLTNGFLKIVQSPMFNVIDWVYSLELTQAGTVHLHACLWSNAQYFNISKIKSIYKYRFTCTPVRDLDRWLKYIFEDKYNPLIIDYCKRKGVDQFRYAESSKIPQIQERYFPSCPSSCGPVE